MRILILSHLLPYPPVSGVLARCFHLLREVARHHCVELLAFAQRAHLPTREAEREALSRIESLGVRVRSFRLPEEGRVLGRTRLLARNLASGEPFWLPRFRCPVFARAVREVLAKRPPDVVQFETIAMAPYGELAPTTPQLLVHQNVESELLARRARYQRNALARSYLTRQARRMERYERECLRRIPAHVAVCPRDREGLQALAPEAWIEVVPNGVDVDYFTPGGNPVGRDDEVVLLGGMNWPPNADAASWFVSEIWPRIVSERPKTRLVVVGSHPAAELRAARRRDPARIEVLGFVPDVRPYVARAGVFVCPLRVGGGTRLKILEAWAMGKAIVSTSVGCEGLGAVDGREIRIADEAQAFAAAVTELLADPERRQRLGEAGRRRAEEEFAWPRAAAPLLELYERLAAGDVGAA